jgi:hypothetical protein
MLQTERFTQQHDIIKISTIVENSANCEVRGVKKLLLPKNLSAANTHRIVSRL